MLPLVALLIALMEGSLELQGFHCRSDVAIVSKLFGMDGRCWQRFHLMRDFHMQAVVFPVVHP